MFGGHVTDCPYELNYVIAKLLQFGKIILSVAFFAIVAQAIKSVTTLEKW